MAELDEALAQVRAGTPTGAPVEVLTRGSASALDFTRVFIAAARAAGIPATEADGILSVDGAFFLGHWAEIFVGEWISFDVLTGSVASADHVQLRSEVLGRPLTIEVAESAPHRP